MLDKIIKQQLDSLEVAKVSAYNEANHRYLFKRIGSSTEVGKTYIIQLDKNLTIKELSNMLANNWNHGLVPTHTLMKVEVKDKMGTMYLVHGDYLNEDYSLVGGCGFWEGWLPIEQIGILEEVK